jgi:hypothetical protein
MFGSNVLEVAIGVVFVYLVLSLICSVINEQVIARFLALRAKTLEDGITTMLNDVLAKKLYNHELIQGLSMRGRFDKLLRRDSKPSYISSDVFAMAIRDIVTSYKYVINPNAIPPALQTVLEQAKGDAEQELVNLEKWFNDSMERVSGWYKRKVQLILFVIGFAIALCLNVDSIALVSTLANNATLRSSIVAAAQGTDKSVLDPSKNLGVLEKNFQTIQPALGWTASDVPQDPYRLLLKVLGLLATAFAVSLGAPFWFDILGKIAPLRATGNPPSVPTSSTPSPPSPVPTSTATPPLPPQPALPAQANVAAQPAAANTPLVTPDHYLGLKDGVFDTTTRADLDQLFTSLGQSPDNGKLVIHFHGGLVDLQAGKANAQNFLSYSESKGLTAYQVFFIWESGFFDALMNILTQELGTISEEPAFKSLQQFADGRLSPNQPLQNNQRNDIQGALKNSKILNNEAFGVNIGDATNVLERVVERTANHRDHGLQATIIEEILRQFYLDKVGAEIWQNMKKTASDAFGDDGSRYGGIAFLQNLRDYWARGNHPHITLVGHSAGAIYICYFLRKALEMLPNDIKFDIVLLAPACTFKFFSETLTICQNRIANIRIYGMQDERELNDILVTSQPWLYPSSLLYFVSGVLEDESDMPLLGMQRYHSDAAPYTMPEVQDSLGYLRNGRKQPTVWSLANSGDGLNSDSRSHGAFYNDTATLDSVLYIIENGF